MRRINILEYLEESEIKNGERIALSDDVCSLSFSHLAVYARRIGSGLLKGGFYREPVIVFMDRSPKTVCAFMGVLYAGCFYACIDPNLPRERAISIIDTLRARVIICDKKSQDAAKIFGGRAEILCYDDLYCGALDEALIAHVRERAIDTDPAYVVFTSGSTGEPKGICASHRSVIDYAEALVRAIDFDENTVFGNQAPLYYDAPLKEILPTLLLGAKIVFIPRELFSFPMPLCRFIKEKQINTLCWTASAFANISSLGALGAVSMAHLKTVCFGSEVFPRAEYDKWRNACPDASFFNLYGPTEATGMSCYWRAERELEPDEPIPIGKPFANTEIILIDDNGRPADEGEIYIRGSCVTNGYFSMIDKSRECFVQNPLNSDYHEIIYKSGDLARINSHGELVYIGRRDSRIKHMGRRIELGEIERAAESVSGVYTARCVYDEASKRICIAFCGEIDPNELLKVISGMLPGFMRPSLCYCFDKLPETPSGKIDRRAILEIVTKKEI